MLIAQIQNGQVFAVADYQSLYPNTSFPSTGPSDEFMVENNCMFVNTYRPYDPNTEKLVPASQAYIEVANPEQPLQWVYTVEVQPLTPEEIDAIEASKKAKVKAQAMQLLSEVDWTQMPDVDLVNKADFTAYRAELRVIALNPPAEVAEWPTKPEEVWSV